MNKNINTAKLRIYKDMNKMVAEMNILLAILESDGTISKYVLKAYIDNTFGRLRNMFTLLKGLK